MTKIEKYVTKSGNCPINDFLDELARDNSNIDALSKIDLYIRLLGEFGYKLSTMYHGYVKNLSDGLYELRPGNNRVIYFFYNEDQTYVLLHGFTKKRQKTPTCEIDKAKKEMLDYIERKNKNGKRGKI